MVMRRWRAGVTLLELVIASILVGVIFLASISIYISALNMLNTADERWDRLDSLLAMEHLSRRVVLGNEAVVGPGGRWVKVRWDYNAAGQPLRTPESPNPAGQPADTWLKYAIVGNTLRWRVDAAQAGEPGNGDPEVTQGLFVDPGGSFFSISNPPGPIGLPVIDIRLRTRTTAAPPAFMTQHTGVTLRSRRAD